MDVNGVVYEAHWNGTSRPVRRWDYATTAWVAVTPSPAPALGDTIRLVTDPLGYPYLVALGSPPNGPGTNGTFSASRYDGTNWSSAAKLDLPRGGGITPNEWVAAAGSGLHMFYKQNTNDYKLWTGRYSTTGWDAAIFVPTMALHTNLRTGFDPRGNGFLLWSGPDSIVRYTKGMTAIASAAAIPVPSPSGSLGVGYGGDAFVTVLDPSGPRLRVFQ
jgi:hypothetical protein